MNNDTITVTVNTPEGVQEVECHTEATEVKARKLRKVVVSLGAFGTPEALKEQPNVVGRVSKAALAAILKEQAKKAQRRK